MPDHLSIAYRIYKHRIYPYLKEHRGATRLRLILREISKLSLSRISSEPESIFEKGSWDNLIILDACRHDIYEEHVERKVPARVTVGSTSYEFLEKTFKKGVYDDIVCVTANAFYDDEMMEDYIGRSEIFHEKYEVFRTDWDEKKGTVLPKDVVRDVKSVQKLFPDKRLIVHFLQPHHPFLGTDFGDRLTSPLGNNERQRAYDMAEKGLIDRDEILKAYEKNLEQVLEYVEELSNILEGKTVVTADHGDLLGENGLYGHPGNSNLKVLRKVPWDVIS